MQHPPEHTPLAAPRRTLRQAFNWRTLKYGSHASLFTVIVLAVVCILYSLAVQHNKRFDVTQAKRFTLAEQSVKLLQGLQYPIKVIGFYSLAERERETFTDLVKQYTQHTDKLSYEVIDPDRQPALAKQYDITAYNTVVVEGNGKKEKISRVEEAALTNAILKVTRTTKKVVYFMTGHGEPALTDSERTGYSVAKQALEEQNYTVQELVLARQPQVPDDAAVVIVAGPRRDLLESETEALSTFLGRGGHLFMMLDPETVPGLVTFVKRYGIEVGNDVVIETNPLGRLIGGDYLMPVVMTYERHAITKELGNVMTMFPVVRSVQVAKELPQGITAQGLAMTSTESWAETDLKALHEGHVAFDSDSDRRGPLSIAAVATISADKAGTSASTSEASEQPEKETSATPRAARLVVLGDSEFANNNLFPVQGNGNFFLNTVSWLAEEEDLIAIRPRKGGGSGPVMLTAAQAPLIFWLPVVLLPLGVLGTGAVVFVRRKWQQ
jgi:gliding motility-associatede transport system auxiliary component